jgi:hypothetical protein
MLDVDADAYLVDYDPEPEAHEEAIAPSRTAWRELQLRTDRWPSPQALLRFLVALFRTLAAFFVFRFARLVANMRIQPRDGTRDLATYSRAVAQFELLCLALPFRFHCLFRSYLLLRFLHAHGLTASWIFGVSLFPFEAHCWVASGDVLLSERTERIERFTPILRIEPMAR